MSLPRVIFVSVALLLVVLCIVWGGVRIAEKPDATRSMRIGNRTYQLEIADSQLEQQHGLMNRTSLLSDHGMYFQFSDAQERTFWMKDTLIPLDLIWVQDGRVVNLTTDVQPEQTTPMKDLKLYNSGAPVDAVIELNAGQIAENGLKIGDTIQFDRSQ